MLDGALALHLAGDGVADARPEIAVARPVGIAQISAKSRHQRDIEMGAELATGRVTAVV